MRLNLLEHNVINNDEVDIFVNKQCAAVESSTLRDWLSKRVRALILNNAAYLVALSDIDNFGSVPQYIHDAVDRGETIYMFSPDKTNEVKSNISDMIDFLNGIAEEAKRKVDHSNSVAVEDQAWVRKLLNKIPKMTLSQARATEHEWYTRIKSRSSVLSKDGGEVEMTWPDGYYLIRFTDKQTMMRDGAQLQNCLATGTYWNSVQNGTQAVYAIRKPNDEAVVGIRMTTSRPPVLHEFKGKANQPIVDRYIPYALDFLKHFGVEKIPHDLSIIGITFNEKK